MEGVGSTIIHPIRFGDDVRVWQEEESPFALVAAILTILIVGQQGYTGGINGMTDLRTLLGWDIRTDSAKLILYFVNALLLRPLGMEGLLLGFVIGHFVLLLGMLTMIFRNYPGNVFIGFDFLDKLRNTVCSSHLGDTRTLAIHVSHTIFYEMGAERRAEMGIADSLIRVSTGIEDAEDLLEGQAAPQPRERHHQQRDDRQHHAATDIKDFQRQRRRVRGIVVRRFPTPERRR